MNSESQEAMQILNRRLEEETVMISSFQLADGCRCMNAYTKKIGKAGRYRHEYLF